MSSSSSSGGEEEVLPVDNLLGVQDDASHVFKDSGDDSAKKEQKKNALDLLAVAAGLGTGYVAASQDWKVLVASAGLIFATHSFVKKEMPYFRPFTVGATIGALGGLLESGPQSTFYLFEQFPVLNANAS